MAAPTVAWGTAPAWATGLPVRLHDFVKTVLLRQLVSPGATVCDLLCGRGTDTAKWAAAEIGSYVGLDLSSSALEDAKEEWEAVGKPYPASFCRLDPFLGDLEGKLEGKGVPFDIVCCLGHLQDCFSSEEKVIQLLENVSSLVRPGGFFFGITADSSTLWSKYQKAVEGALKAGALRYGSFPRVKAELYSITFDDDRFSLFGTRYQLRFVDDGLAPQSKLLVHFPTLIRLAKEAGLEYIEIQNLEEFFEDYRHCFADVFSSTCSAFLDAKGKLMPQIREVLCLYTTFVFRKADTYSPGRDDMKEPMIMAAAEADHAFASDFSHKKRSQVEDEPKSSAKPALKKEKEKEVARSTDTLPPEKVRAEPPDADSTKQVPEKPREPEKPRLFVYSRSHKNRRNNGEEEARRRRDDAATKEHEESRKGRDERASGSRDERASAGRDERASATRDERASGSRDERASGSRDEGRSDKDRSQENGGDKHRKHGDGSRDGVDDGGSKRARSRESEDLRKSQEHEESRKHTHEREESSAHGDGSREREEPRREAGKGSREREEPRRHYTRRGNQHHNEAKKDRTEEPNQTEVSRKQDTPNDRRESDKDKSQEEHEDRQVHTSNEKKQELEELSRRSAEYAAQKAQADAASSYLQDDPMDVEMEEEFVSQDMYLQQQQQAHMAELKRRQQQQQQQQQVWSDNRFYGPTGVMNGWPYYPIAYGNRTPTSDEIRAEMEAAQRKLNVPSILGPGPTSPLRLHTFRRIDPGPGRSFPPPKERSFQRNGRR